MAGRDKDRKDLIDDEDEDAVKAPKKSHGGLIKWLLIGFGIVLLVGVSVGTSIYVMKSIMSGPADKTAEKSGDAKPKEEKASHKQPKIAIYYKFDPPFIANIQGQSSTRFIQLTLEAMTYDQDVTTELDQSMPVIRNNILLLLSSLTYEQVASLEGKQNLRESILKEIQKVLKEKMGKPGVEEVYLTSIVMQ